MHANSARYADGNSQPDTASTTSKLSVYLASTALVIAVWNANFPKPANDNHPQPPPKFPAPVVALSPANDNEQTVFGGPKGMSGSGRANFMTGPLPAGDTMKWVTTPKGKRFLVNPESASHLLGFVSDLEAAGAPVTKISGYNPRRIAGSALWSQHAYGNAIDVDQINRNQVRAAFGMWARSHPDVIREAARKHGIISGGDWGNADFGHFEWGGGAGGRSAVPAAIRFNNPGAQYPANAAKAFGMDGHGVIGGGHRIAHFSDPIGGAASNISLLNKFYVGMTIGAAGSKWTGGNGFGVPGYDSNKVLTHEMLNNPAFMIPFMKAIARREAGRQSPLTDEQWMRAFKAFQAGKYTGASIESTATTPGSTTGALINAAAPGRFTVRQGRRYRATVKLGGLEQWATNDMIVERLRRLGFMEIQVKGSGRIRDAQARWPGPDTTSSIDEHLSNVIELTEP
jgi:hypothetical protein